MSSSYQLRATPSYPHDLYWGILFYRSAPFVVAAVLRNARVPDLPIVLTCRRPSPASVASPRAPLLSVSPLIARPSVLGLLRKADFGAWTVRDKGARQCRLLARLVSSPVLTNLEKLAV